MADGTTISKGEGSKVPSYDSETGKTTIEEGNEVTLVSGDKVTPPAGSVVEKDGSVTEPDGTVIKPDGTVHNTDGSVQKLNGEYIIPSRPILEKAAVYSTGNQVKAILGGECNGAEGYDYVISKNINCIKDKDYYQVSKNQLFTDTVFRYIQKGTYYVYCHAWKKDDNGIKKFSPWSNYKIVKVTAVTPQTPKIERVKVRGNKVYVTYTKCKNATGYDIVLGSQRKKVLGEYRPVEYGKYVTKVGKNTYTAVFTGVKKGTYYAGLHSYNRTSEDGKKVFSPWSKCEIVKVK